MLGNKVPEKPCSIKVMNTRLFEKVTMYVQILLVKLWFYSCVYIIVNAASVVWSRRPFNIVQ